MLKTGEETTSANDWRFVRFYYYADNSGHTGSVDIDSISINYTCADHDTKSAPEAIDSAHLSNVVATTGLTATTETANLSPNSDGGEAVRFTKTVTTSTELTFGFNKSYTLGETAYSKIEFDIWTRSVAYGKTIMVLNTDGSYTSTKVSAASGTRKEHPKDSYVWTSIGNNWYHVELPITTVVSLISGYGNKDIPVKNIDQKSFNAIKINASDCIIDNLRIGSSECPLGIYNNPSYKPSVNEIYWVKTSWVGTLYNSECTITFDDDTKARHIPITDPNLKRESPFYAELLKTGNVTITVNVVCGYNHRTQTITNTITVN